MKKKILFTYGMFGDFMLILTDAPKEAIEEWCYKYNWKMEKGLNTYFNSLKAEYYVKVLADSETDDKEVCDSIGFDETYELEDYLNPVRTIEIKESLDKEIFNIISSYLDENNPGDIPPVLALELERKVHQVVYQINDIVNFLNLTHSEETEEDFPENIISSLKKEGCSYPGKSEAGPVDYDALQREADRDSFY